MAPSQPAREIVAHPTRYGARLACQDPSFNL